MGDRSLGPPGAEEEEDHQKDSSKRKTAFFHLFDWNRKFLGKKKLFSSKLPPSTGDACVDTVTEKHKKGSKKYNDDKLPMAKLLLIAEENRGGFPCAKRLSPRKEGGALSKVDSPRSSKSSSKRRPSVVARLMGLESMPSPEPGKKEAILQKKAMEIRPTRNIRRHGFPVSEDDETTSSSSLEEEEEEDMKKQLALRRGYLRGNRRDQKTKEIIPYVDAGYLTKQQRHLRTSQRSMEDPTAKLLFSKLPSLLPRRNHHYGHPNHHHSSPLRSILSPSKSHNRLASPIRSPLSTKAAAIFIEAAAARILEPKMQQGGRNRNSAGLRSPVVRHLLMEADSEEAKSERNSLLNTQLGGPSSKRVASSVVKALKERSLNRSWNGPLSEKGNSQKLVARKWAEQIAVSNHGKQQEEVPEERRANSNLGRKEGSDSFPSYHAEKTEQKHQTSRNNKKEKQASQVLYRSGSIREDLPPTMNSRPQLPRSRSLKEPASSMKPLERAKNRNSHSIEQNNRKRSIEPSALLRKQSGGSGSTTIPRGGSRSNLPEITILAPSSELPMPETVADINEDSVSSSNNNTGILNYGRIFSSRKDGNKRHKDNEEAGKKKKGESSLMKSLLRRRASMESTESSDRINRDPKTKNVSKSSSAHYKANPLPLPSKLSDRPIPKKDETEAIEALVNMEPTSFSLQSQDTSISSEVEKILEISETVEGKDFSMGETENSDSKSAFEAISSSSPLSGSVEPVPTEVSVLSGCGSTNEVEEGIGDSFSTNINPESKKDDALMLTGKTTAAILQELLTALNTSRPYLTGLENSGEFKPSVGMPSSSCNETEHISAPNAIDSNRTDYDSSKGKANVNGSTFIDSDSSVGRANENGSNCIDLNSFKGRTPEVLLSIPGKFVAPSMEHEAISNTSSADEQGNILSPVSIWRHSSFLDDSMLLKSDTLLQTQETEETDTANDSLFRSERTINLFSKPVSIASFSAVSVEGDAELKIQNEEQYVREIVCASHLSSIDPILFNQLEKRIVRSKENNPSSYDETNNPSRKCSNACFNKARDDLVSRLDRKLVFDCVEEAMKMKPRFCGRVLANNVCKQIQEWRGMTDCILLDDLVEKDNIFSGTWRVFDSEVSELGLELESAIFSTLIEDLVDDFSVAFR